MTQANYLLLNTVRQSRRKNFIKCMYNVTLGISPGRPVHHELTDTAKDGEFGKEIVHNLIWLEIRDYLNGMLRRCPEPQAMYAKHLRSSSCRI